MKHRVALSVVLALFAAAPALSHAQSQGMRSMDMKGMDMKGMDMNKCIEMQGMDQDKCIAMMKDKKSDKKAAGKGAKGAAHKGSGTVQTVDAKAGTVTIAHDPITSMNWPAMTMTFTAKNQKMLEAITSGAKVQFEFVQQGSKYAITSIK